MKVVCHDIKYSNLVSYDYPRPEDNSLKIYSVLRQPATATVSRYFRYIAFKVPSPSILQEKPMLNEQYSNKNNDFNSTF